jgi:3-oxoacyl-[acyl-carrier protein] reductase
VVLLARSQEKLEQLRKELPTTLGNQHYYISVDIGDRLALKQVIESFLQQYSSIQILINNTGGPASGSLLRATEEEFLQAFQNHVLASSLLTRLLLPEMKKASYGRIINVVSTSVKIPIPNLGVSNTIRGAIANWSKTLSLELGPFGITVNNVLPGFTDTPRLRTLIEETANKGNKSKEEVEETWKNTIPLGRFASSDEVAAAVAFLASPAAGYINGTNLTVDGGRTGCL